MTDSDLQIKHSEQVSLTKVSSLMIKRFLATRGGNWASLGFLISFAGLLVLNSLFVTAGRLHLAIFIILSVLSIKIMILLKLYSVLAKFEFNYWAQKISLVRLLVLLVYGILSIIMSFSDTHGFFTAELKKFFPEWKIPENSFFVAAISISVILLFTFIDKIKQQGERLEVFGLIEKHIVPQVNSRLHDLRKEITRTHNVPAKPLLRVCLFVPIRFGFLKWRFQIVCRTDNVPAMEQRAQFDLDEGAIGCAFMEAGTHYRKFVQVVAPGDSKNKIYKDLSPDNYQLISKDIKAVVVAIAAQGKGILGILAIDTSDSTIEGKIKGEAFKDAALHWLTSSDTETEVKLIYRMKNSV